MGRDKIIVKACLNGSRDRGLNPYVPWTPDEVAAEAVRCFDAGASIVHFHARTPEGEVSYDPAWYAEADRLIRSRCDLVLNHTTAREDGVPVNAVVKYLAETPAPVEMVSLNMGYGICWDPENGGTHRTRVTPNSREDILAILQVCNARGIFPEPGIHDMGMLNVAMTLAQQGHLRRTDYFLLEFVARWGDGRQAMAGTPRNYFTLADTTREFFPEAMLLAHGVEDDAYAIAALAVSTGAHLRVGLEDCLQLSGCPPAQSNAELVEWAVKLARLHGREPASPTEARQLLKLAPLRDFSRAGTS